MQRIIFAARYARHRQPTYASPPASMDPELALLRHFLGAIAYRTQKALRDAPREYADFSAGNGLRTPAEILRHMTSLLGYVRTFYVGGEYPVKPEPLADMAAEITRFHDLLQDVGRRLENGERPGTLTHAQLLQGPLADLMTHVGQLALLRRLAGSPVPPENFIHADVRGDRLGADQPPPARPDEHWPEAPSAAISSRASATHANRPPAR